MDEQDQHLKTLDLSTMWEDIFTVNPLVIIGSMDDEDTPNFAPKHMAFPLGWENYFGFVCTPRHSTYLNIQERRQFTVTYPKPSQVLFTSLTASKRREDDTKPELETIPKFKAHNVEGYFLEDGYLFLECELEQFVDGFGANSLILGKVVHAMADETFVRTPSRDDNELIYKQPLITYLHPGRYSIIEDSQAFPFPKNFKK